MQNADALTHIVAIEEIRALKARYCRLLDTRQWPEFAGLFLADAMLDVETDTGLPPIVGRDALVRQIQKAVANSVSSHQVHSPEILLDGPDRATGVWAMQDRVVWAAGLAPIAGIASITGYGQYHETYQRTLSGWQFASIRLTRFHIDKTFI